MRVLFISRAFPPVVGGIERQNYEIAHALGKFCRLTTIANRRGKLALPLFLPYAAIRGLLQLRRVDAILLGDGVLAVIGALFGIFSGKPVLCIVHGLDLTYRNRFYQRLWVRHFLPQMDRLIAVGNETIRQGVARQIPADKFIFIPNGVATDTSPPAASRGDLERLVGRELPGPVLLTLGRLVRRKGVSWFVEHVMPLLAPTVTYLVAGTGPEHDRIAAAVQTHGLKDRVRLLGRVSDSEKQLLFAGADVFIQPNIPVDGDMEGFGLVVLEAAVHALPVIASNLEGLKDAIENGQNGFLVTPGDAGAYRDTLVPLLENGDELKLAGEHARQHVLARFAWPLIARRYLDLIEEVVRHTRR
jgi:phosphatidylinositol alpha-1,6-mannosyltransferase